MSRDISCICLMTRPTVSAVSTKFRCCSSLTPFTISSYFHTRLLNIRFTLLVTCRECGPKLSHIPDWYLLASIVGKSVTAIDTRCATLPPVVRVLVLILSTIFDISNPQYFSIDTRTDGNCFPPTLGFKLVEFIWRTLAFANNYF